jgi:hypothetical protein
VGESKDNTAAPEGHPYPAALVKQHPCRQRGQRGAPAALEQASVAERLSGSPQNALVRDLEVTHTVTGQDGRLIRGTTSSARFR